VIYVESSAGHKIPMWAERWKADGVRSILYHI